MTWEEQEEDEMDRMGGKKVENKDKNYKKKRQGRVKNDDLCEKKKWGYWSELIYCFLLL